MRKKFLGVMKIVPEFIWINILAVILFFGFAQGLACAEELAAAGEPAKEKQVVELNRSLKNIIEENQRLLKNNQELSGELNQLKTDQIMDQSKYNALMKDHEDLSGTVRALKKDNNKYSQEIKRLENDMVDLEKREQENIAKVQQEMMAKNEAQVPVQVASNSTASTDVLKQEDQATDLLSKIDAFNETDEKLKVDSAKAHYNMGNIYFQKGEYELSAREYYQAVTLLPNDPDVHYNLALVSGEYLNDYETSLKHYRMYLYLNPHPADEAYVKEKILESEMHLKTKIESPLERDYP